MNQDPSSRQRTPHPDARERASRLHAGEDVESKVLSVRVDSELLDRLTHHAARRRMTVQDYVLGLLVRQDFDERFKVAVEETERFYSQPSGPTTAGQGHHDPEQALDAQ